MTSPLLLLSDCLESAGILRELANYLNAHIPNVQLIASAIRVVLAVIENVPLVAATMGIWGCLYGDGKGGFLLVLVEGYAAGIAAYSAIHSLQLSLPTTIAQEQIWVLRDVYR
ncbi:hypothetical protein FEM48_Zijuj09G0049800 [Ziziphus jujuba var. spinosa]|uniref:Uncharacterized protein n=1 Tax=Ziziphus jujuba var. spinosa TaxID=714518 RepID=A0A978UR10_ZIZJJ|nr:hypothetical protein FEM48_Zijuj09G0049800 [Ziziphus jujuba var. spinosa]